MGWPQSDRSLQKVPQVPGPVQDAGREACSTLPESSPRARCPLPAGSFLPCPVTGEVGALCSSRTGCCPLLSIRSSHAEASAASCPSTCVLPWGPSPGQAHPSPMAFRTAWCQGPCVTPAHMSGDFWDPSPDAAPGPRPSGALLPSRPSSYLWRPGHLCLPTAQPPGSLCPRLSPCCSQTAVPKC